MTHTPDFTRAFRNALGMFATGIAVVSASDADGKPIGLTINSFNSVSLEPPLIVWSLARQSAQLAAFEQAGYYAVNILAADQEALSQRFASRGEDKFAGLACDTGLGGVPLLQGCCAWFECRNATRYPGGDHVIFLGEVENFRQAEHDPLLYFHGAYRSLAPRQG